MKPINLWELIPQEQKEELGQALGYTELSLAVGPFGKGWTIAVFGVGDFCEVLAEFTVNSKTVTVEIDDKPLGVVRKYTA